MKKLSIVHLYPKEMNIYGDRGNILALKYRLQARGITPKVINIGISDEFDFKKADIIFGGGGQDRGQSLIAKDLQKKKTSLKSAAEDGVAMLMICGMYQLFGKGFITKQGDEISGIGVFNAKTKASEVRMIGNIVVKSPFGVLVGFENHSGQTKLALDQAPLGRVVKGYGNNSHDKFEGAVYKNVFGSYLHGPMLPKNSHFADELIKRALMRKYGTDSIKKLDDKLEKLAVLHAKKRPQ